MAQFLRDIYLSNIKVTEELLVQLSEEFSNRSASMVEPAEQANEDTRPMLMYIIRFDTKGYRVYTIDELLVYFRRALSIERIIITLETPSSLSSNRMVGAHLEVRFDSANEMNCGISVTSNDSNWVDAAYLAVEGLIKRYETKSGWARSSWSTLIVQLFGLIVGFALSIWAAVKVSPSLSIEGAFIITFFFALLIFSNAWTYINTFLLLCLHRVFPNIEFYRPDKDRINWLVQGLIISAAGGFMFLIFNKIFLVISNIIKDIPM